MKTITFFRSLFLFLLALLSQSCMNFLPEGSVDLVKNHFKGPSYDKSNPYSYPPDGEELGLNIAAFYMFGANAFHGPGAFASPPAPASLLASASNRLAFGTADSPPKPVSLFKNEHFALMPGLELIRKGNRISNAQGKDVTHLLYLELPIYALYRHYLPDNKGEVFGGLGPYFAYGLAGNFKSTFNGQSVKTPAFDSKNGGYKRFDGGISFTAGYQFPSALRVRLAYDLGLANLESGPSGPDTDKTYNRAFSVNVGYPIDKIINKFKKQ